MTTKQRKALQQVVLEAGRRIHPDTDGIVRNTFSCIALEKAYRDVIGVEREAESVAFARTYWQHLFDGADEESVGDRAHVDDYGVGEARQIRLLMLALTHTLIGSGDFEAITGYNFS